MATLQDVAQELGTGDVRVMAKDLGLNPPISMIALIRTFIQAAQPQVPVNLFPVGDDIGISTGLSWRDPGEGTLSRASSFQVDFWELPTHVSLLSFNYAPTNTDNIWIPEDKLKYDTEYELDVYAINKVGKSAVAYAQFRTVAGQNPPPPLETGYPIVLAQESGESTWMYYDFTVADAGLGQSTIKNVMNDGNYIITLTHQSTATTIQMAKLGETTVFNGQLLAGIWQAELIGVPQEQAPPSLGITLKY